MADVKTGSTTGFTWFALPLLSHHSCSPSQMNASDTAGDETAIPTPAPPSASPDPDASSPEEDVAQEARTAAHSPGVRREAGSPKPELSEARDRLSPAWESRARPSRSRILPDLLNGAMPPGMMPAAANLPLVPLRFHMFRVFIFVRGHAVARVQLNCPPRVCLPSSRQRVLEIRRPDR